MKEIVFLAGFPRSGSTLLCNLLAEHEKICATPSSPLCSIVTGMRRQWSDDPFLLAQLDKNDKEILSKLKESTVSFMDTYSDNGKDLTIDKNRGWLFNLEMLRELYPNFKMIVTLRDLRGIFASIEKQHRKTLMIEFPDHLEHNIVDVRASNVFSEGGIVGSILKAMNNIQDIPNIMQHLYFWRYEDFLNNPQKSISDIFSFLNVKNKEIDFENIKQYTHESDSYYRMKYLHKIKPSFVAPENIPVSPRILNAIVQRHLWYYETYYRELLATENQQNIPQNIPIPQNTQNTQNTTEDAQMILNLEEAIRKETNS